MALSSRSLRWACFGPSRLWPAKISSNASATLTLLYHETAGTEWQRVSSTHCARPPMVPLLIFGMRICVAHSALKIPCDFMMNTPHLRWRRDIHESSRHGAGLLVSLLHWSSCTAFKVVALLGAMDHSAALADASGLVNSHPRRMR